MMIIAKTATIIYKKNDNNKNRNNNGPRIEAV